jgi:hypothetical protein
MNDMPSASISESRQASVLRVWQNALTKPNEQTFAEIASSPNAKASTGYLWVFVASLIQMFLFALVNGTLMGTYASQYGYGDLFTNRSLGSILITALCGAPLLAGLTTLFFAIGVAIVQWLARMFGGRGTNDQLAYSMAAIVAPFTILSGLLLLLGAIPVVGLCLSAILSLAGIYIFVLEAMAVKVVNQISWGAAIGSLLIPGFVIAFLCVCLIGGLVSLLLPVIRETTPNVTP